MSNFKFSKKAERDLINIVKYTIQNFGKQQSEKYKAELLHCLNRLTENPNLGRSAAQFHPNLRRYNFKSHTIFYEMKDVGIFVVRVLGQKMDYKIHL